MEGWVEKNESFEKKNESFGENGVQIGIFSELLEDKGRESSSSSDFLTSEKQDMRRKTVTVVLRKIQLHHLLWVGQYRKMLRQKTAPVLIVVKMERNPSWMIGN
ncbi:hypothetical protein REPUB_Repub09cG0044400 [Reevesia pubescens]